ncbi:MAG: hypothetical protein ACUVWP_07345 [bacterium]
MRINKIYYILFIILFLSTISFSEQWYKYEHNMTNKDLNFFATGGSADFAVGDNGVVLCCAYPNVNLFYDPKWFSMNAPTNENLFGASCPSLLLYVVGTNGSIFYWKSSNWNKFDSPTSKNLNSITLSIDYDEGFIVGDGGTILYGGGDPPNWYIYNNPPTTNNLYSVSGKSGYPNTTWAVGANGTILDYENGVWSLYTNSPTTEDLYCVYIYEQNPNIGYICGANGTILIMNDGKNWIKVNTPTTKNLYSIWRNLCVGADGTILASNDGLNWNFDSCPVTVNLHGVGGHPKYIWAVGDGGTILYRGKVLNITPESIGIIKALFIK